MGRTPAIRPAVLVVFTALWCALGAGVASASTTVKIDPNSGPPEGSTTTSTAAAFSLTFEPPPTPPDTVPPGTTLSCQLDQNQVAGCDAAPTYGNIPVGHHTFTVTADDGVPPTTSDSRSWTVVPPAPLVTSPPALSNNATPTFTFSDADEPANAFECRMDGQASDPSGYSPCASPWTSPPLSDGTHTFYVRATENGETSATTASAPFSIDTSKPFTRITQSPSGTTNSADAKFAFITSKPGPGSSFSCTLDGLTAPCASPTTYTALASGTHTFTVAAVDALGNVDPTPDTRTWTIQGAPHPSFAVSNLNPLTGVPVTFTNTSTADPGYTVTGWAWDLGGDGSFSDGNGAVVARSFATPGNHTVRLKVVSQPGSGSGTAEVTLHVGNRPPVAGFRLSPRKPRARQDIDLISTATDSDTPIASQTWSVTGRGVRLDQAGDSATARFPRPGNYSVTLRVIDSLGAVSTITKRIKVLERPAPPWLVDVSGLPRVKGARFTKLRVRARQGDRVYVRCRGRRCRVRREFRKTVGPSANVYVRSYQTFFWAGSVLEVRIVDPDYLTKYVRIRVRGRNHGVSRFNGCVVPGKRPGRCP